jgi:hypothetical protein
MGLTQEIRKYRIDDANLIMLTNNLISFLERDLIPMTVLGMSQDKINELKALNNGFKDIPIDTGMKGLAMQSTQDKQVLTDKVKEEVRLMALRCRMKWGVNSTEEQSLGLKGIGNFTDENLLVASRRVHLQMSVFLPDLGDCGLTQAILDNLENLNSDFENALNTQKDRINSRLKSTKERIRLGNEIYGLVAKYCEMGKYCFVNTNAARYKDYIIYHDAKSKAKKKDNSGEIKQI